jgi:hypothetical protein
VGRRGPVLAVNVDGVVAWSDTGPSDPGVHVRVPGGEPRLLARTPWDGSTVVAAPVAGALTLDRTTVGWTFAGAVQHAPIAP